MKKISDYNLVPEYKYPIIRKEGNTIIKEFENGWEETTYDKYGREILFKNSYGVIREKVYQGNIIKKEYLKNKDGEFWIKKYNIEGKEIYYEESSGYWIKRNFNEKGQEIYNEDSNGNISTTTYNEKGQEIFFKNNKEYWRETIYDKYGNEIGFKDSYGNWRHLIEEGLLKYDKHMNKYELNGKTYIKK